MRFLVRAFSISSICILGVFASPATGLEHSGENWQAAFAQADTVAKPRPRIWTGERLAAAKKKWGRNKEKFSACATELDEKKKLQKVSLNAQGDFLERCMRRP